MLRADVQGGLDQNRKIELEDVLHWLRSLQPPQAALIIFENVEDAIADSSKAQVTPCNAATAGRALANS